MSEHDQMVVRLAAAMENGEFEMFFQPAFAADGHPLAVESLLRWRHPERGLVPPVVFLAMCEASGLILPLGRWVLAEACAYRVRLAEAGWPNVAVSVNMSAAQLADPGLLDDLGRLVREFAISPGGLELEFSEATVMVDADRSASLLGSIRALGISVAIDAFGTGYSSMAVLHRVPVDKVKIDRSVVHDVHQNKDHAAICRSIVSLAHGRGLTVIAEGVELSEEHEWLRAAGCDGVQGYLFARPAPFEDMLKALGNLPG